MNTTHTPGPWTELKARTLINIKGANGEQVAQVSADSRCNSRLIAAAPELLAALKDISGAFEEIAKAHWPNEESGAWVILKDAKAATKKAEGR